MLGLVMKWIGEGRLETKAARTFDYTKTALGPRSQFHANRRRHEDAR